MELDFYNILWISGLLLLIGIILNKPSKRFGVPGLVLYLSLGIFLGNGGKYDFVFDYPEFTLRYSEFALSMIIFIGGLETNLSRFRPIFLEGVSLSTIGVLSCSLLVGLFGWLFLDLSWLEAWLLGAIVSSTDAAAVFSILQSNKLRLKQGITEVLELESGTNDPMAYFLTISLTASILGSDVSWIEFSGQFILGIIVGVASGYVLGRIALLISEHLNLDIKGLYPLILVGIALITFGLSANIHANLLLAMYCAGITVGNGNLQYRTYSINFFESISWLMEISMFVILGLQVYPHEMVSNWPVAVAVALFLMLVARPSSVFLSLYPMKVSRNKSLFISWIGLRGATPIVFSLVPLAANVRHSELIFNAVFIIVISSILLQGTTMHWLARRLKLLEA